MIDWVTVELPLIHQPINSGQVMKVAPDGSVDWLTRCRHTVLGTFESTMSVKSSGGDGQGRATHLWLSGNPSKFLQGHNVFGSDDLLTLVADAFLVVAKSLNITVPADNYDEVRRGDYSIKTIDINYSYELPTRADVLSWIRAAEYKSKTRHGRPQMKGGTLYWGKSSSRWALKVYCKAEELEAPKHRLPLELESTQLKQWADNKLRLELRLMSKELAQLGIDRAHKLNIHTIRFLYDSYVRRLEMNDQIALKTQQELALPQRLRSTYILWKNGEDLRSTLTKATFYRHRNEFLTLGIDITIRQKPVEDQTNIIPLVRVLEAKPAIIPLWAFEQNLIHHSASA